MTAPNVHEFCTSSYIKPNYPPESTKNDIHYLAALEDFDKALALQPDYDEARSHRVRTLYLLHRFKECIEAWNQIACPKCKKESVKYALSSYKILAYEAFKSENYEKSIDYNKRVLELYDYISQEKGGE